MNSKTIKKILKKKNEDFLKSIHDENVRELVQKNSIITGGSIASMLLGEPVNDFDYYFANKETALAVARYYIEEFKKNNPETISPEIKEEDDSFSIFIRSNGMVSEKKFSEIGGSPYEDVDVCVDLNKEEIEKEEKENQAKKGKYRPIFISENAITLSNKVQLILRFYGDAEEIHKNYDFVHCTNYWTSINNKLVLRKEALESILTKNLIYQGSLFPICSVIRTRKFLKRGWYINAGQFLKMCFQISDLDLSDIGVLKKQLTGVDALYFYELISCCENKMKKEGNNSVDTAYITFLIDEIFS